MTNINEEILDSETQDNDGDDVTVDETEDTSSETETADDELEKAKRIAADQKRRAEKAEAELKELKSKSETKTDKEEPKSEGQKETMVSGDQLTKEEAILYARGLSEEEVEKVKSIAKIEGESPLVSAESDYFKHWQSQKKAAVEADETQLGASKGSMKTKPKKDFSTTGLSAEEHKAMFRDALGR